MELGGIIKHNQDKSPKTGEWRYMKPVVDAAKCIGCKTCVPHCPEAVMEMRVRNAEEIPCLPAGREISNKIGKEKELVEVDFEYCKGCGVCAQVCPVKAINMKK
ncbi:MAG: pyruvate synthase delta chain [uncultured bacterium]|nr:MAG: pyruvate synthase delta chain [uncultured bacterium]